MSESKAVEGGAPPLAPVLQSLQPICSTDGTRDKLLTPFRMEYAGVKWAAATDGHLAVALVFDGDVPADGPDLAAVLTAAPRPTHSARLAELRTWAGPPMADERVCRGCNGQPQHTYCPACGGGPRCDGCGGTGRILERARDGKMLGGALNRILLSKALFTLPEGIETVEIGHPERLSPYLLSAPGWLAALMPLRYADDNAPEFTSLVPFGSAATAPQAPP